MAPRKPSTDEQLDELRQAIETLRLEFQETLQSSIETALTTVLQRQQQAPPQNRDRRDDVIADERFDNIFANQQQHRRAPQDEFHPPDRGNRQDIAFGNHPPRWESSFRSEIPEFLGTLNHEDFIDWLNMVEEILDFRQVPDDMRVSLVVTRFKGRAMAWWQQLKESRRQANKERINTWARFTKHMRRNFLPYNYERTLYNKLQNLRQGNRSVEDYASDFFHMSSRIATPETEQQLISRFIGGLKAQLQNALQQFNPTSVSEAYQRALAMEIQLRPNWSTSSRPRQMATDSTAGRSTESSATPNEGAQKETATYTIASSRPPRTNALRCYSCGERGHIQTACTKQNRRGLLAQETNLDDEPRYDDYDSDGDKDIIEGDTGPPHTIISTSSELSST